MEDLMLSIISLLTFICFIPRNNTKFTGCEDVSSSIICVEVHDTDLPQCTNVEGTHQDQDMILTEIMKIYTSDISDNKREKIVLALHEIAEYIDTSEFFEEHPEIHSYIFSI